MHSQPGIFLIKKLIFKPLGGTPRGGGRYFGEPVSRGGTIFLTLSAAWSSQVNLCGRQEGSILLFLNLWARSQIHQTKFLIKLYMYIVDITGIFKHAAWRLIHLCLPQLQVQVLYLLYCVVCMQIMGRGSLTISNLAHVAQIPNKTNLNEDTARFLLLGGILIQIQYWVLWQ